eukprot:TRINITY_DN27533_c0_g1_i1.p1 TRINITY_DN27533_c0_g1~~TRINITY_DN27533_c0_g1_i1.p1  ORF type:complete len:497 (-),score=63.94 TRINITY_DN27533_c0_g1_i1:50-1540(-)
MGNTASCEIQEKGKHEKLEAPPVFINIADGVSGTRRFSFKAGNLSKGAVGLRVLKKVLVSPSLHNGLRDDVRYVVSAMEGLLLLASRDMHGDGQKQTVESGFVYPLPENMDEETRRYLASFGRLRSCNTRPKFRSVVRAVLMSLRWRALGRKGRSTFGSEQILDVPIMNEWFLCHLHSWGAFNVFEIEDLTGGRPLSSFLYAVLMKRGLVESFGMPRTKLQHYIDAIEKTYTDNPYHNAYHATDVVHGCHVLLEAGIGPALTELEILALFFAAGVHDAGHPGVTNDFRIQGGDDDAITYSDQSVSERSSLAMAFRLINVCDSNWQSCLLPKQRTSLRAMIIDCVLHTDMAVHFQSLQSLEKLVEANGPDISKWDNRIPVVSLTLHASDLSNCCRPKEIALKWADRVLCEFFRQGDRERALGRAISPLCDRESVSRPNSQVGFMDFIVRPTLNTIGSLCTADEAMANLDRTYVYWTEELAKESREKALQSVKNKGTT